jgi:hypothetical protein
VRTLTARAGRRVTSVRRCALLVTSIIAAQSCGLAQMVAELNSLALTAPTTADSVARRPRRTLNDVTLTAPTCYAPVVAQPGCSAPTPG